MKQARRLPFPEPTTAAEYIANGIACNTLPYDYAHAIDQFSRALELEPDNADAFWRRGWTYWYQGERAKSKDDFLRAIELDPECADDVALAPRSTIYDEAIEQNPLDYQAYCKRGRKYQTECFLEEAREQFTQSLSINPAYPSAYYCRGELSMELRAYENAIQDFSHVIALAPQNLYAYYYRAWSYHTLGMHALARADFHMCLSLTTDKEHLQIIRRALRGKSLWSLPTYYEIE